MLMLLADLVPCARSSPADADDVGLFGRLPIGSSPNVLMLMMLAGSVRLCKKQPS